MEKKKYIKWIIGAAALVLAILQPTGVLPLASPFRTVITAEAAAKKPGKVKLTKISSSAYNKVKISWKKASNATRYAVYYKQSGTSKWKKLAAVKSGRTSYTHTSSKSFRSSLERNILIPSELITARQKNTAPITQRG